jgi:hypothetical protein
MARAARLLACLLAAAAAAHPAAAALPSIYVDYDDDCVFAMHADGGFRLTSTAAPGTTIPPGTYQVVLRSPQDAPSCPLRFRLQGPGVQLDWDFGGEALNAQATETLRPGATYVATDLRDPTRYRAVFTTATSGSSSMLVGETPSTATGKGEASSDLVGSAVAPYRGVLEVTLDAGGAVALRRQNRRIVSLRPGRYDLAVVDRTARRGLVVEKRKGRRVSVTGAAFVGSRTTRVALTSGTWTFSAGTARSVRVAVSA